MYLPVQNSEYWTQAIGNEEIYNTGGEGEMQARLQEPDRFPLRRSESSLASVNGGFFFSFFLFSPRFIFCLVTRMLMDGLVPR